MPDATTILFTVVAAIVCALTSVGSIKAHKSMRMELGWLKWALIAQWLLIPIYWLFVYWVNK